MVAIAAGVGLVAGFVLLATVIHLRRRLRRVQREGAALRAAVEARFWEDGVRSVDHLDVTARKLRDRSHEVNNVLSTAMLSMQLLFDAGQNEEPSPKAEADLNSAAEGMVEALQRLKDLIQEIRKTETTTTGHSSLVEPVDLVSVIHACVERARVRHPDTTVVVREPDAEVRDVHAAVCAGRAGAERALDAVLANACEGDGENAARNVEIRFAASREVDVLALEIADDGPGFTRRELLGMPIKPFETTKRGAQGLGLYTAEHIARASGGSLRRANADGGGAVVSFFLPVAPESAAPTADTVLVQ